MIKCNGIGARRIKRDRKARQHEPHRVVIAFKGKALQPGAYQKMVQEKNHYREQLDVETDKTRWWLQEKKLWQDAFLVTTVKVPSDSTGDLKEVSTIPIFDNPDATDEPLSAFYFLGFDAEIYFFTEAGPARFDPDKVDTGPENKYLVKKLRRMRKG